MFIAVIIATGGKTPAKDHAAVWVPDNDAPRCQMCRKTEFTVIQRRVSAVGAFEMTAYLMKRDVVCCSTIAGHVARWCAIRVRASGF